MPTEGAHATVSTSWYSNDRKLIRGMAINEIMNVRMVTPIPKNLAVLMFRVPIMYPITAPIIGVNNMTDSIPIVIF